MKSVAVGIVEKNVLFVISNASGYNEVMKNIATLLVVALLSFLVLPRVNWGRIAMGPAETVSVLGEAKSQQKNQIATFSAGVEAINNDKESAISEVNSKMEGLIKSIKDFGIAEADLQTQNMSIYQSSIYQSEESYYENGVQRSRKGQWRVSNSVQITLREIERANELTDLLSKSGATNTWGPNFSMDDTNTAEKGLYDLSMKDAREKAEAIAKVSGRTLGKVISVVESGAGNQVYPLTSSIKYDGMGGSGLEPGSSTVYKTLNVVFELK